MSASVNPPMLKVAGGLKKRLKLNSLVAAQTSSHRPEPVPATNSLVAEVDSCSRGCRHNMDSRHSKQQAITLTVRLVSGQETGNSLLRAFFANVHQDDIV
ncbi:MAG: hypothetical protein WAS33_17590 [Candidatus Promineifilaceae bacterium]